MAFFCSDGQAIGDAADSPWLIITPAFFTPLIQCVPISFTICLVITADTLHLFVRWVSARYSEVPLSAPLWPFKFFLFLLSVSYVGTSLKMVLMFRMRACCLCRSCFMTYSGTFVACINQCFLLIVTSTLVLDVQCFHVVCDSFPEFNICMITWRPWKTPWSREQTSKVQFPEFLIFFPVQTASFMQDILCGRFLTTSNGPTDTVAALGCTTSTTLPIKHAFPRQLPSQQNYTTPICCKLSSNTHLRSDLIFWLDSAGILQMVCSACQHRFHSSSTTSGNSD